MHALFLEKSHVISLLFVSNLASVLYKNNRSKYILDASRSISSWAPARWEIAIKMNQQKIKIRVAGSDTYVRHLSIDRRVVTGEDFLSQPGQARTHHLNLHEP